MTKKPHSGIAPYILAAKPPPSLLTPHSSFEQNFHPESRGAPPTGYSRTPNPEPALYFLLTCTTE